MSYDIKFGVKIDGTDIIWAIDVPEYDSPTYNVGTIFRKCMQWDFDQGEWYRLNDVIDHIKTGLSEIIINPGKYKKDEPTNGWGSTDTVRKCLTSIIDKVEELKSYDLPQEHLWIRW